MDDLAVVLVSHHSERWLRDCLTSVLGHVGHCRADIVVVNNADDATQEILSDGFPSVRSLRCENRGFAHANNQALATCNARYCLFLNVDTQILDGTFEELVGALDARPAVGVAGVRQVTADGRVAPTMRRFPSALGAFGDSVGLERFPSRPSWLGERDLVLERYEHEQRCDWMSGSFLIARREVLFGVGVMDERFFLYSEEPDLCLRARQGGWQTRYLPVMTVLHHGGNSRANPKLVAQDAFSRMQFAHKHFSKAGRTAYAASLGLGYSLRALAPEGGDRRHAARIALRTLLGMSEPPFGPSPEHAISEMDDCRGR